MSTEAVESAPTALLGAPSSPSTGAGASGAPGDAGPSGDGGAGPARPAAAQRSGKVAWIVIGLAMLVGAVLGIFVYFSAAAGSVAINKDVHAMRDKGLAMTSEECVANTLSWFEHTCDAVGRMCIDAVPRMVGECLAAKDRSEACVANGNNEKPSQWAYHKCQALGVDKNSKKPVKESCTAAWRAFDSWCKSGQKGVAL